MLELLNIRFTYSLRNSHQNSEHKSAIVLRISFRGERRDIFTGLYCFKKNWNAFSGTVVRSDKQATTLNQNLSMIIKSAHNSFDEMRLPESFTIMILLTR
jgi:hypothetical protein